MNEHRPDPDAEVARGSKAQRLLQDDIFCEAFATVRDRLVSLLEQDQPDDKRERLSADLRALARIKKYVEQVAIGGKMAAQQIEQDKTIAQRLSDRLRSVA